MKHTHLSQLDKRQKADLLIIPLIQHKGQVEWPEFLKKLKSECEAPIKAGDFNAKEGETLILYPGKQVEPRWMLLGLGEMEAINVERLRRAFASSVKVANRLKAKSINLLIPPKHTLDEEHLYRGIAEGVFLSNYVFNELKSAEQVKKDAQSLIQAISWIGASSKGMGWIEKAELICKSVCDARDLVNGNADDVAPSHLAEWAEKLSKREKSVKVTTLHKKQLEKEGLGLLLAVSRGSFREPKLIIAEYQGAPKSKEKTMLVGKGVTYDTGGLNLKPTGSMETMKCDMGGAASVLAAVAAASALKLKVNLVAIVPATENSIGSESYKPGDVYKSYLGKTVEIGNTDAEGRLILADALAYGIEHYKPTRIIDLATLTGAIEIALGNECSGLFANNDALADSLIRAGSNTFERVWRMPVHEEYRDLLKSEIADIKNHGGRAGGAITAALFLQEFIGKTPWAHIDIAGTAYLNDAKRYNPRFATGVGVRLLIDYLESIAS